MMKFSLRPQGVKAAAGRIRRWTLGGLALALLTPSLAHADLMLYPTRVVLEGGKRTAQVELVNRGDAPETYRLRIVNQRMTETGEIVPIESPEAGEQFADHMLRYTPRQVTLQPGASQTVRISLRKPADLASGEYRSHLQFDRIAETEGAADIANTNKSDPKAVSIVLRALVGASIPVIVRHGQTSATVRIDSLRLEPNREGKAPELSFVFRREGNRSVYGDVVVTYAAAGRKPIELGKVTGVAVYAPNPLRKARLPLTVPDGVALRGGEITVRYSEKPEAGGALIAETRIAVP